MRQALDLYWNHGISDIGSITTLHVTTRVDPTRDTVLADSTPIDYLDFASPVSGLGSKMGLDATHKWPGETSREWGRPLQMSVAVTAKVQQLWRPLVCESNLALDPVHAA